MQTNGVNDVGISIGRKVAEIEPALIEVRRDIHEHPEIGFELQRTAGVVAAELDKLGLSYKTGIGKTGIVADIKGGLPGPCLVIRADMDALPIQETTGLPFASKTPNAMHACGHDIHTATLLGVGAVLKDLAPKLKGTIRLVFQPAEEISPSGAAAMIEDGVLEGVDMALAFHNDPSQPAGMFGYNRGASTASVDNFDITITGSSGHAARPQDSVDPIVAAAHMITQMQTIVSREINPAQGAVVTIGHIAGGTTHNIIPDSCSFCGTVRARSPEARKTAKEALERIAKGIATTLRVDCEVKLSHGCPPLMNDDKMLEKTVEAVRLQYGDKVEDRLPGFGGEDFAYFSERVPSFHLRVGSSQPGRHDKLHNSGYQPDESCIGHGVAALSRAAVEILS